MRGHAPGRLTAVLGPTNTGKTHLAIERMCAHASGMMGFPLRLLAREVYDRVVAIKGKAEVALITGEERILPAGARYFLCTAESMPRDRAVDFVALDEAQLGADPERGHVFTERLLQVRGLAETMILGAATLAPLVRRLLPDAEIISRPRFSKLSFAGPRKLSRLPRRSAVVAFSAEDVYALAEMLRRQKGGAAVVMGALSPRTRNAQVALYQSGEVDYLVATDAIGMGLNMDIAHVAFAGLAKFDGRRHRRLTIPEMAQIAGRAGRHARDGSFGAVQLGEKGDDAFAPEEIEAIEGHGFAPLTTLVWRNARLDFASVRALIASLEARPPVPELVRAEDALDLAVLRRLAREEWVLARATTRELVARLWSACGLPDFLRTGADEHARLAGRVFRHLSEGNGHLPADWIAGELARLDQVDGDIGQLSQRIAAARTWSYAAHRADWLEDAAHWAARARAVEDRLSDALHDRLTQRFVDRRTAVLLRDLRARPGDLALACAGGDDVVRVEGEAIGRLDGFRFIPDPTARAGEKRLLLAAAERRLGDVIAARARAAATGPDADLALHFDGSMPPRILWRGRKLAKLMPGRDALNPRLVLDRGLDAAPPAARDQLGARVEAWFAGQRDRLLGPLVELAQLAGDGRGPPGVSRAARGLIVQLVEGLGVRARDALGAQVAALTKPDRAKLTAAGVRIGALGLFIPALLRPEPTQWRLALWGVARGLDATPPPPRGRVLLEASGPWPAGWVETAGFWRAGSLAVRLDLAEQIARGLHAQRSGREPFVPSPRLRARLGAPDAAFAQLLRALGYRPVPAAGEAAVAWSGIAPVQRRHDGPRPAAHSPFHILSTITGGAA